LLPAEEEKQVEKVASKGYFADPESFVLSDLFPQHDSAQIDSGVTK
jgi:hypothetical protein